MSKIKKSLAVILAAIMLATFMPLFASAAVAMSASNATLIEAPKLSYKGGEATSNLVVPGGATKADIAIVGGKISYNGTPVEGFFSWSSSATGTPSTSVLAVGGVTVRLYFHPTDTTNYSRGSWWSRSAAPIEGWPTLSVDGLDATIVTAPTVSGDLIGGYKLNTLTLSGGKVTDADGNDITANGTWSFVNATSAPTESGAQEVQWKCAGYDIPKTTVNVTVKIIKTTLVSGPEPRFTRTSVFLFNSRDEVYIKEGSGKIVDEDGNDVTANGTWTPVLNMTDTVIMKDTEIDVKWTATGYAPVDAKMVVTVSPQYSTNLKLVQAPAFNIPTTTVKYEPNKKMADVVSITPGELVDDNGNKVDGTWTYRINGYGDVKPEEFGLTTGRLILISQFIPNDTSLPTIEKLTPNKGFTVEKGDFTLAEGSELVLNYGTAYAMSYNGKDLRFSTFNTVPESATVYSVSWASADIFDPSTADYGSVTMVEVKVTPENQSIYNTLTTTIPVRIQPYTMSGTFTSESPGNKIANAYMMSENKDDGLITYHVDFKNARLFGNVVITATDGTNNYDIATVTPDENNHFYVKETWQAPADGNYIFTFTYVASEKDTAVFATEKLKTIYNPEGVDVDMKEFRTVTVKIGSTVYTEKVREDHIFTKSWSDLTDADKSVLDHWLITDANGKEIKVKNSTGGEFDTTEKLIQVKVPEHDIIITAISASGEEVSDNTMGGSFWSFFERFKNWLIELYRTIVEILIPTMETL